MRIPVIHFLLLFALGAPATALFAEKAAVQPENFTFFESKIRPVLIEHCYECHSAEAEKSKGGLLVDSRQGLRQGGDQGPAVVPGKPEESLLLVALTHADPDLEMPPKKAKLSDSIAADFRSWIADGAPDPRDKETTFSTEAAPVSIEAGKEFWSFLPLNSPPSPENSNAKWARQELDHFVLAELEVHGLTPSPDAEPAVLVRRLHFDLVGLPPSPRAVRQFLVRVETDGIDGALAEEADSLLASERFGERWARHWMDVARFAESSGKESNLTYPHAWRYRDYAIDAFNAEIPFDRFILENLAGDLLPAETEEERARLLVASGFLAFGTRSLNEQNKLQFFADGIDEQIDTITRALLAQSVACARCHDHKFDPFHMTDYYALAGIFASTLTHYGTWVDSENNNGGPLITLPAIEGQLIPNRSLPRAEVDKLKAQRVALDQEEKDRKAAAREAAEKGENPGDHFSIRDALRIIWQRGGVDGKLATVDDEGNALPLCMGAMDRKEIVDAPILERGEVAKPGEKVPRGFPRVIEIPGIDLPGKESSGRLEFAQWIAHPENPLTARVMANRIWHHLLGTGIVRTTDNFGFTGERPSHPALLDHLALRFLEEGWSTKALVREIVLSRTWRQSSEWREAAFTADPDNRLLWRASKRRLDAECIRDAMLAASGELDTSRRAGSLVADLRSQSVSLFGFNQSIPSDLDGVTHRSVYLPVVRDRLPDVLGLFDFAEPSLVTGARDTTNVPVQALYLMNSEFVLARAEALAKRLMAESPDADARLNRAFRLCYARAPRPDEKRLAKSFLEKAETDGIDPEAALAAFCQSLLATAEFRLLD